MSAEIEQAELQDHETLPGHVCASVQAFGLGDSQQGASRALQDIISCFQSKGRREKGDAVGSSFRQKTFNFYFLPPQG